MITGRATPTLWLRRVIAGLIIFGSWQGAALTAEPETAEQVAKMRDNPLVDKAIRDLAKRESISPAEIELVRIEQVTWPDSSLGCPHPEMRYRQVPQDGARIILQAPSGRREYHSGGNRGPFLCSSEKAGSPPPAADNQH